MRLNQVQDAHKYTCRFTCIKLIDLPAFLLTIFLNMKVAPKSPPFVSCSGRGSGSPKKPISSRKARQAIKFSGGKFKLNPHTWFYACTGSLGILRFSMHGDAAYLRHLQTAAEEANNELLLQLGVYAVLPQRLSFISNTVAKNSSNNFWKMQVIIIIPEGMDNPEGHERIVDGIIQVSVFVKYYYIYSLTLMCHLTTNMSKSY